MSLILWDNARWKGLETDKRTIREGSTVGSTTPRARLALQAIHSQLKNPSPNIYMYLYGE